MARLKIPIFVVVIFSFALGLLWGIKIHRDRAREMGTLKPTRELRVLALKHIFPPDLLAAIEKEHEIHIDLREAETPEDLWDKMEGVESWVPDLVTVFSYQVPLAFQMGRLQPQDAFRFRGLDQISADFRSLPGDRSHSQVIPLFWGLSGFAFDERKISGKNNYAPQSWTEILSQPRFKGKIGLPSSTVDLHRLMLMQQTRNQNKREKIQPLNIARALPGLLSQVTLGADVMSPSSLFSQMAVVGISHGEMAFLGPADGEWKFVMPDEKAALWILSLAITRDSKAEEEMTTFVEELLRPEIAASLSWTFRQASTNSGLESAKVHPLLKPSHLRQVPLSELVLWQDFSRSREIRAALASGTSGSTRKQSPGPSESESSSDRRRPRSPSDR